MKIKGTLIYFTPTLEDSNVPCREHIYNVETKELFFLSAEGVYPAEPDLWREEIHWALESSEFKKALRYYKLNKFQKLQKYNSGKQ